MMKPLFSTTGLLAGLFALSGCAPETNTNVCEGRVFGDLVISEVMIDPSGADTGNEYVEVFNTLGTPLDLKGFTLFSSAVDGSATKTHSIRSGTVPARGYFTLGDVRSGPLPAWVGYTYNTSLGSLSNGSGTVGIRCGQTVIASHTWNKATAANRSRQLDGMLEVNADNAAIEASYCDTPAGHEYAGTNSGTPGAANVSCNTEQTQGTCLDNGVARLVVHPQPGDLIINEVMSRPAAVTAANGEWVELYAQIDVDLNDLSLKGGSTTAKITSENCLRVAANRFVVLARNADTATNGGIPEVFFAYSSLQIPDTGEQQLTLSSGSVDIDVARFTGSTSGKSWQLDRAKLDPRENDSPSAFCVSATQWVAGTGDFGTPGAENAVCDLVVAADPDTCFDDTIAAIRPIRIPNPGQLAFTEWMSAPTSPQTSKEWIEALTTVDFDLNNITLQIGSSKTVITAPNCIPVSANSYLVFGKNTDPLANGGLPSVVATFTSNLTGTSVFSLLGPDGGVFDTINASGEFAGAATQVAPGFENPTDNDTLGNRCKAPNRWAATGDFGSPGVANPACAVPPDPNSCIDQVSGQMRQIRHPAEGSLIITEWMADPNASADTSGEYIEVLTTTDTDLNGLTLLVGSSRTSFASSTCLPVAAGTYLVFAHDANPLNNGNLPPLAGTFTGALTNSSAALTIIGADGGLYDTVTYSGVVTGASTQLMPSFMLPTDNDLPANLCTAPTNVRYGLPGADGGATGDRGTPGLLNVCQ